MAVVRPLHAGVGIVALGVRLDTVDVETHYLAKDLTYLIFGEFVLARELQDFRHAGLFTLVGGKIFGSHVCITG